MSFPFLGRRFRVYQPLEDRVRPRTCTTKTRPKAQPRRIFYRQSVSLPVLVKDANISDSDDDYDHPYTERYNDPESHPGSPRKASCCTRLPAIDKDIHLNAKSSRQLVINQQKLMFKYQNLEHQFKKLQDKAALIKRELDKIRVMKTPEPDIDPPQKGAGFWTTNLDYSGSISPQPAFGGSESLSPSIGSRPTSLGSIHLGSSCMFRSPSSFTSSTRYDTPSVSTQDSTASSPLPSLSSYPSSSPSTSLSGDSSFMYSDTEDEEETGK